MRQLLLPLFLTLSLLGCSSEEPASEPAPEAEVASPAAAPQAAPKKAPKKAKRKRRRYRTKQKGKRRKKRPAKAIPEGHVYLNFRKADLKTQVLPVIESQCGVKIVWLGAPREVHLPLKRALPWEEGMDLICRFSDTHLVRAYTGRYELRDGYKGQLESEGLVTGGSKRGAAPAASSSRKSQPSGSATSSQGRSGGGTGGGQAVPTRRSGSEARDILRGMGTRNSGSRNR